MTRELNSSSPQKNIDAFAVKGFARSVTMQRFRPCCMRIVMTAGTSLGGDAEAVLGSADPTTGKFVPYQPYPPLNPYPRVLPPPST